jgi:hypothetical protein
VPLGQPVLKENKEAPGLQVQPVRPDHRGIRGLLELPEQPVPKGRLERSDRLAPQALRA